MVSFDTPSPHGAPSTAPFRGRASDPRHPDLAADLRKIASGDDDAFGRFHRATLAVVSRLSVRIVGDRTLAEDVVADVYVSVWRQAAMFDPARGSAARWVSTLTRSRAIDHLRTVGMAARRCPLGDLPVDAVAAMPEPETAPVDEDPMTMALDRLPPKQREVIRYAYFEGLSQRDVARQLGIPLGTVKTRARLAVDRLRRALVGHRPAAAFAR